MAIKELPVFPQTTYSETQGLVGIRQWQLDHGDNIEKFCDFVCKSHWPSYPDAIPIQVQSGAYNTDTVIKCAGECTKETMGPLPKLGAYKVIAHYAMHRMMNKWPTKIPKPWHPPGTTLSLKIHGSGQMLLVTPAGMTLGTTPGAPCNPDVAKEQPPNPFFCRIILPVTEYHIACDRMTLEQVNQALNYRDWDDRQGSVNQGTDDKKSWFLGAPPGTLLFDGYEINESFACDVREPCRYRMTACLKQRVLTDHQGTPRKDGTGPDAKYLGWNHDYVACTTKDKSGNDTQAYGWRFIKLSDMDEDGKWGCFPRYAEMYFQTLFGNAKAQTLGACADTTTTVIKDSDLCGKFDVCEKGNAQQPLAVGSSDNANGSHSWASGEN